MINYVDHFVFLEGKKNVPCTRIYCIVVINIFTSYTTRNTYDVEYRIPLPLPYGTLQWLLSLGLLVPTHFAVVATKDGDGGLGFHSCVVPPKLRSSTNVGQETATRFALRRTEKA